MTSSLKGRRRKHSDRLSQETRVVLNRWLVEIIENRRKCWIKDVELELERTVLSDHMRFPRRNWLQMQWERGQGLMFYPLFIHYFYFTFLVKCHGCLPGETVLKRALLSPYWDALPYLSLFDFIASFLSLLLPEAIGTHRLYLQPDLMSSSSDISVLLWIFTPAQPHKDRMYLKHLHQCQHIFPSEKVPRGLRVRNDFYVWT